MKKIHMDMQVSIKGRERLITAVRVNGRLLPEKAVVAAAAVIQRELDKLGE